MKLFPTGKLVHEWRLTSMVACLAAIMQAAAQAAPCNGDIYTFRQSDGSVLELKGFGDWFSPRFETQDGYTAIHDETQDAFCYAKLSRDGGQLASTGISIKQAKPAGLQKHIRIKEAPCKQIRAERRQQWTSRMDCVKRWDAMKVAARQNDKTFGSPPDHTTTGKYVGLTVLVEFPDEPGTITQQQVLDFCNKPGYNENKNNGSVYDYFLNNSNKLLEYTNIVVGYYRAEKPKSYYNKRESNVLVEEVAKYVKNNPPKDLAKVSTYPNGNCRAVNIYYAGDSPESNDAGLWPHAHVIDAVDIGAGKKINDYQMTNMGTSLKIGVFCHENGHLICSYPDIYDGSSKSTGGAGYFCLMDAAGSGVNPSQICAYLKYKSGWGNVTTITGATTKTGNKIYKAGAGAGDNVGNQFYLYPRPGVATEYYLIENRQKSGNDTDLPAAGIAIWHVDELGYRNYANYKFNATHNNYEVTLMQADNLWHFENNANGGDAQDLFYAGNPAAGYSNAFTDSSALCSKWWDGTASKLSVTSISASGDTMTFDVSGVDTAAVKGKLNGSVVSGVTLFLNQTTPVNGTSATNDASPLTMTTKTAADGSYSFGGLLKGRYTVTPCYSGVTFTPPKVEVALDPEDDEEEDFDTSGADAGSIVVTEPIGGEEWQSGTLHTITWNSSGMIEEVAIDVLKGGIAFKTIDPNADNTESYEWDIDRSYASGSDYQIKITSVANPSISWISNMFSISYPAMRATVGSTLVIADAFDAKPRLYVNDAKGKQRDAKIMSWKDGGTTFTWTASVAEGTYTLFAEPKGGEAQVITDRFEIMEPTIVDYTDPANEGKYYTMTLYGVTGEKPKIWWQYGDSKKLTCTIVGYDYADYTEPEPQEAILIKFKADAFDEFSPTTISMKNALGQTDFQIEASPE